jgi:quercetin dioxygenase-like cupin family protein
MRRAITLATLAAFGMLLLPLVTAAQPDPPPGPTSRYTSRTDGLPIDGPYEIIHFLLDFAPGAWTPLHTHGGKVLVTTIDGQLLRRHAGGETTYALGESWEELPNDPHEVGNPTDAPATALVTALLPEGAPLTTIAGAPSPNPPPGPVVRYMNRTAGWPQAEPYEIVHFLLDFGPGQWTPPHAHGGVVMSTVYAGALTGRTSEHGEILYELGDKFIEYPGDAHQAGNAGSETMTVGVSAVLPKSNPLSTVLSSLDCQYFTESKHSLCSGFRMYWKTFGGLAVYGYPISEEFTDGSGTTVQWFERARFEWQPGSWPERYDVQLGRIGAELAEIQGVDAEMAGVREIDAESAAAHGIGAVLAGGHGTGLTP